MYGGSAAQHRTLLASRHRRWFARVVYLPELTGANLADSDGLLLPDRLHRGQLDRAAGAVLGVLERGGTVVAFSGGEPPPAWLPGVRFEQRPANFWWWLEPGADPGLLTPTPDHPLWAHLALADVTWHHHGVLEPPAGAERLVSLRDGGTLLYVDRVSTPGTLVVATLDPVWHHGSYFMPAAGRFLDGFLPWLARALTAGPESERVRSDGPGG